MWKRLKTLFRRITGISTPIGGISWKSPDSMSDKIVPLSFPIVKIPKSLSSSSSLLEIRHIIEGQAPDSANRVFDVIIANPSEQQILLIEFNIRWQYHHGMLASIDKGVPLTPVAEYVIKLPIDTDNPLEKSMVERIYPVVATPPRNESGPSITALRLQIHYYFAGRIDWHPCYDWDIFFSLSIRDELGGLLPLFSDMPWRTPIH